MVAAPTFSDARELLRKVRRIQIRTSRIVSEALAGQYHSAFKGRGMEFEEVRPYTIGDDVRSIDWNVSARVGMPHVKLFREERELTVMLAVDLSGSLSFGSCAQFKRELAAEVAATVAFSAIRNNDKVGLMAFTDRIERFVPARKGSRHVLRIVRELLGFQPAGRGTRLGEAIRELDRIQRRRSVLFVVSDFLDEGWEDSLSLARQRHDVIPVVVHDRREGVLPAVGLVECVDPETGERVVIDTTSRRVRSRYAAMAAEGFERRRRAFARSKMTPIEVETGADCGRPLMDYFRRREGRKR
ncbi:MAG: DUF58 domain-containing protein [Phycisphaeraceae bacterium]|nr:DUF58 domain-containing protein [Phycisphaeraceae bacterium]